MDFRGQLSGWMIETREQDTWQNDIGLRYIPEFNVGRTLGETMVIDAELSLNSYLSYNSRYRDSDADVELYRLMFRFLTAQTETRIGLQRINFGPAQLLRPLRWFDQLDPRDPLQITDGIYAFCFKYVSVNNASLWLWALYGNEDPKGYERYPTASGIPEFGGRFQYPMLKGELAATYHHRKVDISLPGVPEFTENRYALDGRWDFQIGLWFEAVLQNQESNFLPYPWMKMVTAGMDYTVGIGNGLYFLIEHMAAGISHEALRWDEDTQTSAYSMSYPIGYFDSIMAIGYYSWDQNQYYQYMAWQHTTDNWIFRVSAFYYPGANDAQADIFNKSPTYLGAGHGAQLMVIFNH